MSSGSDPRFRIRMDDGSEVAIPSLEALARRIDRGEILPDTELYDAGMDRWGPARESAVVRFILDEREREGHDPLMVWEAAFEEMESDRAEEDEPRGSEEKEADGPEEDPFDLGLTLEPGTFGAPPATDDEGDEEDSPSEEEGALAEEEPPSADAPSDFESFVLDDDFGAPEPHEGEAGKGEAGEGRDDEGRDDEVEEPAATMWTPDSGEPLPTLDFPDDEEEGETRDPGPQGGTALDEWARGPSEKPGAPGEPLPGPPPSPVARGRKDPWGTTREKPAPDPVEPPKAPEEKKSGRLFLVLILLGILGAGAYFFGEQVLEMAGLREEGPVTPADDGDREEPGPGLIGGDLTGYAAVPPIPQGMEGPVNQGLRAVEARFNAVVDSLRGVHGVAGQPPGEWLSGYYFAHAGEFPQVRGFWEGYRELVRELRDRDPELFLETAVRTGRQAAPGQADEVARYLNERYRAIVPARRERYQQLAQVALRAVEFHDFLEAREGQIRYTPAIGPEVPLDPVLEVDFADPTVRSEVLRSLDTLLQALDRSRGAGVPALGGIANDLFRRFGEG